MSSRNIFLLMIAALAVAAIATPAGAQQGACKVGAQVIDRQDRSGTVVEATGADCRVKLPDGTVNYYLAWMLKPAREAGGRPQAGAKGPLHPGTYLCTAANGNAGKFRLVIRNGNQYAGSSGKTGTYTLDAAEGTLVFDSGPWAEYRGAVLGPTRFGMTSRPGSFYATVCDLQ